MAEPEPEGSAVLDAADFLLLGLIPSGVNAAETGSTINVATPNNNDEAVNNPPLPLRDDASAPLGGSESLHNVQHADSSHVEPGKKKRGRPKGSEGQHTKKRKRTGFIDLTGVPPQPLIPKDHRHHPTKAGSSKFMGVFYHAPRSKWRARISVEGKLRSIGYYDNEEDAAADYVRAAYKYKKKKSHSNVYGGLDLSGAPVSLPLIRNEKAASGFAGVTKVNQRFQVQISIRGEYKYLGTFATPEEAARIYARAKWYVESMPPKTVSEKKRHPNVYGGLDLSSVPVSLPLIRNEEAATGFVGVTKVNQRFQARIFIRGNNKSLGTFATPEEAARIYARAKWYVESMPQINVSMGPSSVAAPNNEKGNDTPLPLRDDASAPLGGSELVRNANHADSSHVEPGKKKKRGRPKGSEGQQTKNRKRTGFIDLTGVPPQPLIPKDHRHHPTKAGSSKFIGVCYDAPRSKWKTQIWVEGKIRFIGCYDNEEDAAADYARAAYKYKKKKNSNGWGKGTGFIDLTGVPPQPLILKNHCRHPTKAGSSKFMGVRYDAPRSKWKTQIMVEEKVRFIGYYDNEEDAAADYARAAYKYKKKKSHPNVYGGLDLSDVPVSLPLIRNEKAAMGFAGVTKNNQRFQAKIFIRGKQKSLGTFDTPEEAARIYARAEWYIESMPQMHRNTNRKGTGFIDLTGVPPQPLILKNQLSQTLYKDNSRSHPTKARSSKFTGIYFDASCSKWKAQIMVKGKVRSIGYYDNEEDAAADYARAAYKYKKKKSHSNVYGGLDLSGAPVSLPLIRNEKAASGFAGVKKNKQRWEARIVAGGKHKNLGTFDTPEEAALIHARGKWYIKSKQQENEKNKGMPSGSSEGPAAVSSDTGFIAEISDTRGANSGGNDGKNADDDPVGDVLNEDPVDTSYVSDVDYSEVDGVAV